MVDEGDTSITALNLYFAITARSLAVKPTEVLKTHDIYISVGVNDLSSRVAIFAEDTVLGRGAKETERYHFITICAD